MSKHLKVAGYLVLNYLTPLHCLSQLALCTSKSCIQLLILFLYLLRVANDQCLLIIGDLVEFALLRQGDPAS